MRKEIKSSFSKIRGCFSTSDGMNSKKNGKGQRMRLILG
jgi:hypothetical protein